MTKENPADTISVSWHIDDVKHLADEQCREVLTLCKRRHDATIGINWGVIRIWADDLFPEQHPDDDTAEAHRKAEKAEQDNATRIRELNDAFRRCFPPNGRRYITDGIFAFSSADRDAILQKVRDFDAFTGDNDPRGEHP